MNETLVSTGSARHVAPPVRHQGVRDALLGAFEFRGEMPADLQALLARLG